MIPIKLNYSLMKNLERILNSKIKLIFKQHEKGFNPKN